MGRFPGRSRTPLSAITSINVTPLVDITLVLLIIFMVTAKLIVGHRAMPVDLPKAASGGEVQEILSVVLAVDGAVQVNGRTLSYDEQILPLAAAQAKGKHALRAVIKADGKVLHERVMHVLDLLRRAGVSKIAFAVVPLSQQNAVAVIRVAVDAADRVVRVDVLQDPSHRFGEAARRCAMSKAWRAARNAAGRPVAGTVTVRVRFVR